MKTFLTQIEQEEELENILSQCEPRNSSSKHRESWQLIKESTIENKLKKNYQRKE